ncbi:DUF3667 domain-containing protein [Telluria sp. B2]
MKSEVQLHQAAAHCPNCATQLGGKFCQGCGQPAHLHVPSAREFLHEFIAHYVALEGKLWKSMALLLFKPGKLTVEYIQGRRVRYVEPLRLYLSFSIIFFAIFKLSGMTVANLGEPDKPAIAAAQPAANAGGNDGAMPAPEAREEAPAAAGDASIAGKRQPAEARGQDGDVDLNFSLREKLAALHPTLGEKYAHFREQPGEVQATALRRAFFANAPYAIFALMPLFAFFLKVLYLGSGRRYGEHVLFALHSNAFAFLMLSVMLVTPDFIPFVGPAMFLWLVFYLPTAMRRVYGGSRTVTALRWIVLMNLHMLSIATAIALATALALAG